jgi:osmotically-inducible protein OsmY
MSSNRWRDDERRRGDEDRYGRSGFTSGWGEQQRTGRESDRPEMYEGSGYGQGSYSEYGRTGRDEEYGRQFGRDEDRQRYGQQYRGGSGYERERSGSGYGASSYSGSSGYDPYRSGQYGGGSRSQWGGAPYEQDWRSRQSYSGGMDQGWGIQGSGYGGYQGSYGGEYRGGRDQERGWWDRTRDEMRSWMGDDEAQRRRQMDEMRQRSHYGRGPRGFTRSDERIREDVCERLTYDWSVDASDIEVNVSKGEVTLTGSVESRHSKRRAEDIVDDVPGVRHVQNNLRVKEATESTTGTTGTTTGTTTTGTGTTTRPTH